MELQRGFHVGAWDVFPLEGEIRSAVGTVHLEPKVMEVLVVLAGQAPEVVRRDELADRIWGVRAAVSDEPLTRCIAQLRQALGDSSRDPKYIQTVPKRGYRLLKRAEPLPGREEDTQGFEDGQPGQHSASLLDRLRQPVIGVSAALLLIVIALLLVRHFLPWSPERGNSIAILPSVDGVARPETGGVGSALSDLINDAVTEIAVHDTPAFVITPRDLVDSYAESGRPGIEVAREIGVAHVLSSRFFSVGDRIHWRVTLDNVTEAAQEWAETFILDSESFMPDSISVASICEAIVRYVNPSAEALGQCPETSTLPTDNSDAWVAVAQANFKMRSRDQESLDQAIELLNEAIELDEHYGDAYVKLARAYYLKPAYGAFQPRETWYAAAVDVLEQGLEKDPSIAKYRYFVEAGIHYNRRDWEAARESFGQALIVAPDDAELLQLYSHFLAATGRMQEAADIALRAQHVAPTSPVTNDRYAIVLTWLGEDLESASNYHELAVGYGLSEQANRETGAVLNMGLGNFDEAGRLLKELLRGTLPAYSWVDAFIAYFRGDTAIEAAVNAVETAERHQTTPDKLILGAWLHLNQWDRALDTARTLASAEDFDVEYLFSADAAGLRRRPGFVDILDTLGLIAYWDQHGWDNDFCARAETGIVCE
jgi:DNA-binding winged helix-turn-helix (wHTH) protein/tetratricopeptide (TPR) repeat protein/TolB-like protein